KNCSFSPIAYNIFNSYITELRCAFVHRLKLNGRIFIAAKNRQRIFGHVIHIKQNCGATDMTHSYIFYVDVFNNTPPSTCCLETETNIGSDKVAIINEKVAGSA